MTEIRTKREFFQRWEAGELGNKLRTWRTPAEALASGCTPVGFRQIGTAGGGKLDIVPREEISATADRWRSEGRQFMICEAAPDHRATIQGEVCRPTRGSRGGLCGIIGRVINGRRMRDSIAAGDLKPVGGAQVSVLLSTYMDANSRDDLDALLERYPDAAIEFTCYEISVGCYPRRNTIFWEVRNY